jgi:hypothetical protein
MNDKRKRKGNGPDIPSTALAFLLKAGWTPRRAISTSLYEEAYRSEGRPFLLKAKQFLARYGGLIIPYVTKSQKKDVLAFLAEREVHAMDRSGVECFEELIGVAPLCPIGHYQCGTCILFMDKRGHVFGGSDETLALIGRTGEEAVGNILSGAESEVLEPRAS